MSKYIRRVLLRLLRDHWRLRPRPLEETLFKKKKLDKTLENELDGPKPRLQPRLRPWAGLDPVAPMPKPDFKEEE